MTIFDAFFQGMVQGLTEFLPVSSSGHLSLIQHFTGVNGEQGALFTVMLHLGTLLAVFLAFYKTILCLIVEVFAILRDLFTGRFRAKEMSAYRRMALLLLLSLLPMAFSFLLLDFFDSVAADGDIIIEGFCFLLTSALLFLSLSHHGRKTAKTMTARDALSIGAMQAVAPLPGLSRSGSTIAVGMLCGLEREFAVSFSFIMGVPTVLGANLLKAGDIAREMTDISVPVVVAGLMASLVFGLIAIRMVRWLVTSDKFKYFAWYTMILGGATVLTGLIERFGGQPLRGAIMGLLAK